MSASFPSLPAISADEIVANSFRDYHVKGFDYICLRRSPAETVKLYFFDGDVSKLPEVVNPHDHRYNFKTLCIAGSVENIWFSRVHPFRDTEEAQSFERFEYRTPLLGGNGFTHTGTDRLIITDRSVAASGAGYWMYHDEIHTIRMVQNETVIALVQYEDLVRETAPTYHDDRKEYVSPEEAAETDVGYWEEE